MRLELGAFPVQQVTFGRQTRYADGLLEIDADEMLAIARTDPRVTEVDIDLAHPGESARIVNVQDVIEPRVKVDGPGVTYPGVCGRPVETVGQGRTLRLAGVGVVMCADLLPYKSAPFTIFRGSIDMTGPGAADPHSALHNLCLTFETDPSIDYPERNEAAWNGSFLVSERLAQTVVGQSPPLVDVYDVGPVDAHLPKIALVINVHSVEHHSGTVLGFGESVYGLSRLHPPWLFPIPEVDAVVSLSSGRSVFGRQHREQRPAVARAIGGPVLYTDGNALDGAPIPATAAAPGGGERADRWGSTRVSCFDY